MNVIIRINLYLSLYFNMQVCVLCVNCEHLLLVVLPHFI